MPTNKLLYIGRLVGAAAALISVGAWLTARISFAVPYAIGVGALMIIAGLVMEAKKKKAPPTDGTPPPTP
ncbi:MAG: hypothetical protein IT203_12825 [Fimbriimonadaceae bacterium]|nr:hypothetical protein [Fimbriimonadaceae bacterium]